MKLTRKWMSSMLLLTIFAAGCSNKTVVNNESEEGVDIYSAEYAGAREEGTSKDDLGDVYYSVDYVIKYQFPKVDPEDLKEDSTEISDKLTDSSKKLISKKLSTDVATSVMNFASDLIVKAGQDVEDYIVESIYSLDTMCQVKLSNGSWLYNVCGLIPSEDSDEVQLVYTVQQYVTKS